MRIETWRIRRYSRPRWEVGGQEIRADLGRPKASPRASRLVRHVPAPSMLDAKLTGRRFENPHGCRLHSCCMPELRPLTSGGKVRTVGETLVALRVGSANTEF